MAIKSAEGNYQYLAVVTAGVIMTEATTQEVKKLFQPFQEHLHQLGNQEKYHPIAGKDALDSNNLAAIFPSAMWRTSKYMEPQFAADLRAWLIEPDFAATQRQPLELNNKQKKSSLGAWFGFMTIDFGSIKSYNADRGFGFVGCTFSNPNEKVFFHIKKIKKKYSELAQKLDNREADFETINFWYKIETNEKGQQVSEFWTGTEDIPQNYTHELYGLIQKVENIWKNVSSLKPSWLDLVTTKLVGVDRKHELSVERDNLESQLREAEEERRRNAKAIRQDEIRRIANVHNKTKEEAEELGRLLSEMRPLNFTRSKQLSEYIVKHQLGYRYPNISGIVRMEGEGKEWNFSGGFPPDIYRIICEELDLGNQGTRARAIGFTSFNNFY